MRALCFPVLAFIAVGLAVPLAQGQSIQLPVRGSRTAALMVTSTSQTLVLLKRDLNIYAGADPLDYQVKDAAGQVVQSGSLADDGITTAGGGAGTLQKATLLPKLPVGAATLVFTSTGSDSVFDVQATGAQVVWQGGNLMLNDGTLKGSLYLLAPQKGGTLTVGTWHSAGNTQTVQLLDGAKVVASAAIAATHTDYTLKIPAPSGTTPVVLQLSLPKMDLYLSSSEVAGYATSAAALAGSGGSALVYPLGQTRGVAPGGSSALQLRLTNSGTTAVTLSFTLPSPAGGFSLALATGQASQVTLAAGQKALFLLTLSCATGTPLGTQATLYLSVSSSSLPGQPFSAGVTAVAAGLATVSKTRPFLFYSQAELTAAKVLSADPKNPWAAAIQKSFTTTADAWLTKSIEVPTGEGAWSGYYVCAKGPGLTYNPATPTAHYCSADGKTYTGEPYDGCWRTRRYNELASAARSLGMAYRLTGTATYAKRAADILLGFSRIYLSHAYHDNYWGTSSQKDPPSKSGGRLLSQTLDESGWLIHLLSAYDDVATSGQLTSAERVDIEHNLLRPAVVTIQKYDAGKSNWQAWHNAAIGSAGYCLGESAWVSAALTGTHGFSYHMQNSMLGDGFWYEGSIGYHTYTLSAYRWLALAARHAGQNLYSQGLLNMVKAPILMAYPDSQFPKLNDGGTGGLSSLHGALEAAAALTTDTEVREVLRFLYNDLALSRSSEEALLLAAQIGTGSSYLPKPFNFFAVGYAVLREGAGKAALYAGLDYGPHGGGHGHYDKLQLIVYGALGLQLPDMGTTAYRLPYHAGFFQQTIAHNTVMLNETCQAAGNETARTVNRFKTISIPGHTGLGLVQAQVGADVFGTGNQATRTVLLLDDELCVDRVQVTAPSAKDIDLLFHADGDLDLAGDQSRGAAGSLVSAWASSKAGHSYLSAPTLVSGKQTTVLTGLHQTQTPLRLTWRHLASISHTMDHTQGLSAGVVDTTDKVQGTGSIQWDADNSGTVQSLSRTYTHDKLELSSWDTLEFSAKFSQAGLKWFGVKIYDLPTHDQSYWRLDDKQTIPANTWVKFSINLQKPEGAWGGATSAEQIVFRLQGSGSTGKVTVWLDDLRVTKGGVAEVPLARGVQVQSFGGGSGEPVRYLAADAPDNPPTSEHPMVLVRAKGGTASFLSLVVPFDGQVPVAGSRLSANEVSLPRSSGGSDWAELDPSGKGTARWVRTGTSGEVTALGLLAKKTLGPTKNGVQVTGTADGDLVLLATTPADLTYKSLGLGPFSLTWPAPTGTTAVWLDGKAASGATLSTSGGKLYAQVKGLPDGQHVIKLVNGSTGPDSGPLYKDGGPFWPDSQPLYKEGGLPVQDGPATPKDQGPSALDQVKDSAKDLAKDTPKDSPGKTEAGSHIDLKKPAPDRGPPAMEAGQPAPDAQTPGSGSDGGCSCTMNSPALPGPDSIAGLWLVLGMALLCKRHRRTRRFD